MKRALNTTINRSHAKAERRRKITPEIWEDAKARLAEGWTFEVISGRAKKEKRPADLVRRHLLKAAA